MLQAYSMDKPIFFILSTELLTFSRTPDLYLIGAGRTAGMGFEKIGEGALVVEVQG